MESMESMEFHGIPWNPWNSMDSIVPGILGFRKGFVHCGLHFPEKKSRCIVFSQSSAPRGNSAPDPPDPADPADPPETQHPVQNRPWVPHAGGQDDGSLHKLPQTKRYVASREENSRTHPRFPTPGGRMTVVYPNSIKID